MEVEDRSKHLRRGKMRIAEMERHVQCLRGKLCRLEKLLPSPVDKPQTGDTTTISIDTQDPCACPVDELAKKEKSLREQIYAMECTEQAYVRRIADESEKKVQTHDKIDKGAETRSREAIQKDRLDLLESYGRKLCDNLRSLDDNRAGFTREAHNLSLALEKTRRCGDDDRPVSKGAKEEIPSCGCKVVPKCNSCIICSCDDWERDLDSGVQVSSEKTEPRKSPCPCRVSSCSSSDSAEEEEDTCQCQIAKTKRTSKIKKNDCTCEKDAETSSSDCCSSDDYDDDDVSSKCTCYCSKDHSHEDLTFLDSSKKNDKKVERCRGGLDASIEAKTTLVSYNNRNYPMKELFPAQLKLLRVDELRAGLERLKIRNRNIKDFLRNFDDPRNAMDQSSSETASLCTDVSSCSMTRDLARQTRSGLLTVIGLLEGKCRSKDAVILALADELKTTNGREQSDLRMINEETNAEKPQIGKKSPIEAGRAVTIFTKKDSAIGFLIILLILASRVKKSEMTTYISDAKKIATETTLKIVFYTIEMQKSSIDRLTLFYGRAQKYIRDAADSWRDIDWTLQLPIARLNAHLHSYTRYVDLHKFHFVVGLSIIIFLIVIVKFRKAIADNFRISDIKSFKSSRSVIVKVITILKMSILSILSSKIFWVTFGFCGHFLWSFLKEDFNKYFDKITGEKCLDAESSNDRYRGILEWIRYSWFVSAFIDNLQGLVNFSYSLMESVMGR